VLGRSGALRQWCLVAAGSNALGLTVQLRLAMVLGPGTWPNSGMHTAPQGLHTMPTPTSSNEVQEIVSSQGHQTQPVEI